MCFDEERKQLPLAYVLMSGKPTADYAAVFNAINNRLNVAVEEALMDYEKAMWIQVKDSVSKYFYNRLHLLLDAGML
jgi:hypothetical protein